MLEALLSGWLLALCAVLGSTWTDTVTVAGELRRTGRARVLFRKGKGKD